MVKIEFALFGYRRITVNAENVSLLSSILLRAGIPSIINSDGHIIIRERDFEKTKDLLSGRMDFAYSEPLGAYGAWKKCRYKAAMLISFVVTSLLVCLLSGVIWDIRVEGNSNVTDAEIILELNEYGFEVGQLWSSVNKSEVEASLLDSNDKLSWININRRGCVAYVKVIESDNKEEVKENRLKHSNIIADLDCVIEEITVKSGTPNVKVGDTVKKGDLLVIGVLPEASGGGLCAAEATVIGRVSDSVSVKIGREEEKNAYSDRKIYSITLKIFKFSLNIFKLYGNLTNECDIIENEVAYSLFGRYKLPLSVRTVYYTEKQSEPVVYSDEKLVEIATKRLHSLMADKLLSADLIRLRTSGEFTEEGYYLRSDIVYLTEVGEKVEILLD